MGPEEYKGFLIVEAPKWMYKATKIVPSSHFKRPFKACKVKTLKIAIYPPAIYHGFSVCLDSRWVDMPVLYI